MPWQIILFRVVSALSIGLSIVPLAWHIANKNIPAVFLTVWIVVYNLCIFTNTFIWPNDSLYGTWDGKIFCDIQIKILIASATGQMGAVAAIMRNLAKIMSDDISVIQTRAVRRRELIIDLVICLLIPVYMMAVHYVVQPVRYTIYAITGCAPTVDRSWPTIVLLFIWPPIAALICGYYSFLVILRLHRYRNRFNSVLSSNSSLSRSRFARLFVLSLLHIIAYIPVTIITFKANLQSVLADLLPYDWKLVHGIEWTFIVKYPTHGVVQLDRWVPAVSGIVLFLFFGLGADAVAMYRDWLRYYGLDRILPNRVMGVKPPPVVRGPNGDSGWSNTNTEQGSGLWKSARRRSMTDIASKYDDGDLETWTESPDSPLDEEFASGREWGKWVGPPSASPNMVQVPGEIVFRPPTVGYRLSAPPVYGLGVMELTITGTRDDGVGSLEISEEGVTVTREVVLAEERKSTLNDTAP